MNAFFRGLLAMASFGQSEIRTRPMTDEEAWEHDWNAIGGDFRRAIAQFEQENADTLSKARQK